MSTKFLWIFSILLMLFVQSESIAQTQQSEDQRINKIAEELDNLADSIPALNTKIDISVEDVSLQDFINGIAENNRLNISVEQSINSRISTSFSSIPAKEIIVFLCKKYQLEIHIMGSIIVISPVGIPPEPKPVFIPKQLKIQFSKTTNQLSFDLSNDSLNLVTKELTKISGRNFVFTQEVAYKPLTGYVENLDFDVAMQKLAFSNNLDITISEDSVYQIDKKNVSVNSEDNGNTSSKEKIKSKGINGKKTAILPGIEIDILPDSIHFNIRSAAASIEELIAVVTNVMGYDYFLFSEMKGNSSLKMDSATVDSFLKYILNGSDYTFRKEGKIYLLGERSLEGLRNTEVFNFKYRTVDKVLDNIPAELKKGIEIKPFPDLNSMIISGSQPRIDELIRFLNSIDRVVPLIQIEVLIIDVRNTNTLSTGLEAGLKDKPTTTGGKVFPSVDLNLSSKSINSIISSINGLGVLNLGKVTPNFYFSIKALEQQGVLKIRSTPKLATLNGHEAKLSIGRTEYYLEIQSSVVGVQNPYPVQSQQYKSVNADLSLTINPIVSGDDQITLDISVQQSSFTERISQTAPPGTITRDFQSLIRVKNEEMVILGGLDENTTNDSGEGVPFLSRIPFLKWFFSSRTKAVSKNKIAIFIKPTVLY